MAGNSLFASNDLDETREKVTQVFCPHRLRIVGKSGLRALHNRVDGQHISLNYLEYGAKIAITETETRPFYLVEIPLSGGAAISNGSEYHCSSPKSAVVLNPDRGVSQVVEAGTRHVLVQIETRAYHAHLENLLDMPVQMPLRFEGSLDLSSGSGRAFRNLILHLISEVDSGYSAFGGSGLMSRQIEQTIMTGLIEAHPNNYSSFLGRATTRGTPGSLRRAEAYILANLDQAITLEDIAAASGTTPRSLQLAFRHFRGTTPLTYLRDQRLLKAHEALATVSAETTVTDIATTWGFMHLGRFSRLYKARFGRLPSETMRAASGIGWDN